MADIITIYPDVIEDILTNPGIGFIAAPNLMGDIDTVQDHRGVQVDKYKFTDEDRTWNHPDSKVYYCGVLWKDIELEKGTYHWKVLDDKLELAKSMGCTAVVRCLPYALSDEEDIPSWYRQEYPEEPEFPFWRVDPNMTPYVAYWSNYIKAFASHYDGNPIISSVDMAIVGAWGEGGGTEFLREEQIQRITEAYIDNFKITPLQALLHDPKSLEIINRSKGKVGFRVDCLGDMGGFHGDEWSHMLDFYPENIQNFHMGDAWKKAPVVFEACWHMNDWYLQGWDIDYIIDESLKWHISSYNNKGTTVPEPWKKSITRWIKKMGYRFEIRKFLYDSQARVGQSMEISALIANVGVAPIYHKYPLVLRLRSEEDIITLGSQEDIRSWLPDRDIIWKEKFQLPQEMPRGSYVLEVGIETGVKEIGNIKLAIAGELKGYYPMGLLLVE